LTNRDPDRDFEEVYRTNVRPVLRYALSRTDPDQAREVVERTFVVVWRRFKDVPSEPLPWLIGVARKQLSELRRSEGRRVALGLRLAAHTSTADSHATSNGADRLILQDDLKAALRDLRADDQEVLMLVAWQGFGIEQLSEAMGCSKAAASVRLHRARRRFARLLSRSDQQTVDTSHRVQRNHSIIGEVR
jgi:RNA polymerase sigma-70 factor (ECF subfamily)